jgi:hypothetical protein
MKGGIWIVGVSEQNIDENVYNQEIASNQRMEKLNSVELPGSYAFSYVV